MPICRDLVNANTPIRTNTGDCRKADDNAECVSTFGADVATFRTPEGACRLPQNNDECDSVNSNMPEYDSNSAACRAATSDNGCPAVRPIFDETDPASVGNCRLANQHSECPSERPFYHTDAGGYRQLPPARK